VHSSMHQVVAMMLHPAWSRATYLAGILWNHQKLSRAGLCELRLPAHILLKVAGSKQTPSLERECRIRLSYLEIMHCSRDRAALPPFRDVTCACCQASEAIQCQGYQLFMNRFAHPPDSSNLILMPQELCPVLVAAELSFLYTVSLCWSSVKPLC
jgi:hypothetical protein